MESVNKVEEESERGVSRVEFLKFCKERVAWKLCCIMGDGTLDRN